MPTPAISKSTPYSFIRVLIWSHQISFQSRLRCPCVVQCFNDSSVYFEFIDEIGIVSVLLLGSHIRLAHCQCGHLKFFLAFIIFALIFVFTLFHHVLVSKVFSIPFWTLICLMFVWLTDKTSLLHMSFVTI